MPFVYDYVELVCIGISYCKGEDMAVIGLIVVVVIVWFFLKQLPKGYSCKECGYWTPDRQDAAGHQHLHSLHKMDI